jgi:hypothetical protein
LASRTISTALWKKKFLLNCLQNVSNQEQFCADFQKSAKLLCFLAKEKFLQKTDF